MASAVGDRRYVRLKAHLVGEVKVLSKSTQLVTDCNCVVATRGGEQQEVNGQSVRSLSHRRGI